MNNPCENYVNINIAASVTVAVWRYIVIYRIAGLVGSSVGGTRPNSNVCRTDKLRR